MSQIEDLRAQIAREERESNLPPEGTVSPVRIRRRRRQMCLVAIVVAVGLLVTTVVGDLWQEVRDYSWIDTEIARIALVVFGAWVAFYVYEKDRHLRRLSELGRDVARVEGELAAGMLSSALVADAVAAVHSSLDLDATARQIAFQGLGLLGADTAWLRLADADGVLHDVFVDGDDAQPEPEDDAYALAAAHGAPLLLTDDDGSVLFAALRDDSGVLGVLAVRALAGSRFSESQRSLVGRFATQATVALEHSRRYEAAVFLLDASLGADAQIVQG